MEGFLYHKQYIATILPDECGSSSPYLEGLEEGYYRVCLAVQYHNIEKIPVDYFNLNINVLAL